MEQTLQDSNICPYCKGSGWVFVENNTVKSCRCREKEIESRKLRFADIPDNFKDMQLQTFSVAMYREAESKEKVKAACSMIKQYLAEFEANHEFGMGLYIFSKTKGSGKTRMAASIANELLKSYQVKFAVSTTILKEIKNSWNRDRDNEYTESRLLDDLSRTDILVIDDFGTEQIAGWINDKFYHVINERYINQKVTIFTSNDTLNDLQYDTRITNRIKEKTYQIAFPEESVREHIAEKNQAELLEKLKGCKYV